MKLRSFLPSLALLLTGCAGIMADGGAFPSLARRPVESRDYDAPASAPVAAQAPTADPALDASLARFTAQSAAGAAAFDKGYPDAQRLARAASGAAVSSEAWVAAQVAVSGLEQARNDSVSALASLDTLYTDRMNALADGKATGGTDAIDAARGTALSTVDSQNDRLDALKGLLPQP